MTSTSRIVTRTAITRRPLDIDPKVAGVLTVAGATIALAAAVVAAKWALTGQLDLAPLSAAFPVIVAAAVGYIRTSSHRELIEDGIHQAADIAGELEPVIVAAAPAEKGTVEEVVDGIRFLEQRLDQP